MRNFAQKAPQPISDTRRRPPVAENVAMSPVQQLQRRVGNQALQRMAQLHASRAKGDAAARNGAGPEPGPMPTHGAAPPQLHGDGAAIAGEVSRGKPVPAATARPAASKQAARTDEARATALAAPAIAHKTAFSAPGNADDTRAEVGVGEIVTFTGSAAGTWTASAGKPAVAAAGSKFEWVAPGRAASVTIQLKVGQQTASETMTVVEPAGLTADKVLKETFPSGTQGAGMYLRFCCLPANVVFGAVEVNEWPGPATKVSGVFDEKEARPFGGLWHFATVGFGQIGLDNKMNQLDHASSGGLPPKLWKEGAFEWRIPNYFRLRSEGGFGTLFNYTIQRFEIEGPPNAGRTTVTKLGQTEVRTP